MRYRKKPVVIEAVQFTEAMARGVEPLPDGVRMMRRNTSGSGDLISHRHVITTLEGEMEVQLGDFVITGVKGEHYPCKPDFAATYEPVEAES